MQVGISTASFYGKYYTEQAIDKIAELNCLDIEVFLASFCEYESNFVELLKSKIKRKNMKVNSLHSLSTQFEPQLFAQKSQRQRDDALLVFKKVLSAARELDCHIYVMHGYTVLKRGSLSRRAMGEKAEIMQQLCELAFKYGVKIALENVHWSMFNEPEFATDLIRAGAKDVFFTLDVKQALQSGYSLNEYIDCMNERLINVHICDYVIDGGKISLCLPFSGQCDFPALKKKLDSVGYKGNIIVEVYSDAFGNMDELKNSVELAKKLYIV